LLSNEIIDILTPVLLEIEDNQLIIDFHQFAFICEKYLKGINVEERNKIIGPKRQIFKQ